MSVDEGHAVLGGPHPDIAVGGGKLRPATETAGIVLGDQPAAADSERGGWYITALQHCGFENVEGGIAHSGQHGGDDAGLGEVDPAGRESLARSVETVS
ncbi:hypothetical protein [Rhodococcus sp. ZPP]|uniref:hypothetical protein n=1 Tax=Rhodococcus sp. ZPP TaxID=2749906 RepID=UPI001FCB8219|nr:hypothetical protein [Rhodococcus sp. ZPP]